MPKRKNHKKKHKKSKLRTKKQMYSVRSQSKTLIPHNAPISPSLREETKEDKNNIIDFLMEKVQFELIEKQYPNHLILQKAKDDPINGNFPRFFIIPKKEIRSGGYYSVCVGEVPKTIIFSSLFNRKTHQPDLINAKRYHVKNKLRFMKSILSISENDIQFIPPIKQMVEECWNIINKIQPEEKIHFNQNIAKDFIQKIMEEMGTITLDQMVQEEAEITSLVEHKQIKLAINRREAQHQFKSNSYMNYFLEFKSEFPDLISKLENLNLALNELEKKVRIQYLIMPFKEGISLEAYLKKYPNLSFDSRLQLSINLIKAVREIHIHNVLHLDLHPCNILVNKNTLEVSIIDFGLSQHNSASKKYARFGRLDYLHPTVFDLFIKRNEQDNMKKLFNYINEKMDNYALGLLLILCWNGKEENFKRNPDVSQLNRFKGIINNNEIKDILLGLTHSNFEYILPLSEALNVLTKINLSKNIRREYLEQHFTCFENLREGLLKKFPILLIDPQNVLNPNWQELKEKLSSLKQIVAQYDGLGLPFQAFKKIANIKAIENFNTVNLLDKVLNKLEDFFENYKRLIIDYETIQKLDDIDNQKYHEMLEKIGAGFKKIRKCHLNFDEIICCNEFLEKIILETKNIFVTPNPNPLVSYSMNLSQNSFFSARVQLSSLQSNPLTPRREFKG